jgi:hypothetical protein
MTSKPFFFVGGACGGFDTPSEDIATWNPESPEGLSHTYLIVGSMALAPLTFCWAAAITTSCSTKDPALS